MDNLQTTSNGANTATASSHPLTITADQLVGCGVIKARADIYVPLLNARLYGAGITTKLRLVHLLAQLIGESDFIPRSEDLGHYTAENLVRNFSRFQKEEIPGIVSHGPVTYKHFKPKKNVPLTHSQLTFAERFRNNALILGRENYAKVLGDTQYQKLGGYEFRGHGLIQITGKNNYHKLSAATHIDYEHHTDLLDEPEGAITSALWFWKENHVNKYADLDDIMSVSRLVNFGRSKTKKIPSGLDKRKTALHRCKHVFGVADHSPVTPHPDTSSHHSNPAHHAHSRRTPHHS